MNHCHLFGVDKVIFREPSIMEMHVLKYMHQVRLIKLEYYDEGLG